MTRITTDDPKGAQVPRTDDPAPRNAAPTAAQDQPRVIDENTDLSTLTDQEIMRLMENAAHSTEDVTSKVRLNRVESSQYILTAPPAPDQFGRAITGDPERIRERVAAGRQKAGLATGARMGSGLARTRRRRLLLSLLVASPPSAPPMSRCRSLCVDAFAAFTLAYLLRILHSPDPALTANLAFDALQRAVPSMQQVGFEPDLVSLFLPPVPMPSADKNGSTRSFSTHCWSSSGPLTQIPPVSPRRQANTRS